MGSKSSNTAAVVLPLLLILFTLSSQARLVESTGRKLAAWKFGGAPIIWTPPSNSCGASPAIWYPKPTKRRPCRRPPGIGIPASFQSP
ncbi:hypothetical protein Bca52824_002861 [Brassica carinata]|uniref:Transmembrane protein n=1 Tax=Brassica carinata TaxID=52824 RepID=A0A8X7WK26_BRACI|nr:hypothetical protein Bca52824_002861 [Brassica carinata]